MDKPVIWMQYVGSRTRESVVLECAHIKYEFKEENDYKCAIPMDQFAHIITPDKTSDFVPCQPPIVPPEMKGAEADGKKKGKDGKKGK